MNAKYIRSQYSNKMSNLPSFSELKTLKIEKHAKLKCPISLLTRFKAPNLQYLKLHGFGKVSAFSFIFTPGHLRLQ